MANKIIMAVAGVLVAAIYDAARWLTAPKVDGVRPAFDFRVAFDRYLNAALAVILGGEIAGQVQG